MMAYIVLSPERFRKLLAEEGNDSNVLEDTDRLAELLKREYSRDTKRIRKPEKYKEQLSAFLHSIEKIVNPTMKRENTNKFLQAVLKSQIVPPYIVGYYLQQYHKMSHESVRSHLENMGIDIRQEVVTPEIQKVLTGQRKLSSRLNDYYERLQGLFTLQEATTILIDDVYLKSDNKQDFVKELYNKLTEITESRQQASLILYSSFKKLPLSTYFNTFWKVGVYDNLPIQEKEEILKAFRKHRPLKDKTGKKIEPDQLIPITPTLWFEAGSRILYKGEQIQGEPRKVLVLQQTDRIEPPLSVRAFDVEEQIAGLFQEGYDVEVVKSLSGKPVSEKVLLEMWDGESDVSLQKTAWGSIRGEVSIDMTIPLDKHLSLRYNGKVRHYFLPHDKKKGEMPLSYLGFTFDTPFWQEIIDGEGKRLVTLSNLDEQKRKQILNTIGEYTYRKVEKILNSYSQIVGNIKVYGMASDEILKKKR